MECYNWNEILQNNAIATIGTIGTMNAIGTNGVENELEKSNCTNCSPLSGFDLQKNEQKLVNCEICGSEKVVKYENQWLKNRAKELKLKTKGLVVQTLIQAEREKDFVERVVG